MELGNHPIILGDGWNSYSVVKLEYYPNLEPFIYDDWSNLVEEVLLRPNNLMEFMAGMFLVDSIEERTGHVPQRLILPFVPGSRQDRINQTGDYLFTIKSIAKIINDKGFRKVTILDPHSDVTPALIDRCEVKTPADTAIPMLGKLFQWDVVISPDAGAEKRAAKAAQVLGVPLLHAWKTRDVSTGKLSGFGLQSVDPSLYKNGPIKALVVDDICDGGGTFLGLGEVLRNATIRPSLYVTHGLFTKDPATLKGTYEYIFTTDSVRSPYTTYSESVDLSKTPITLPICQQLIRGY